MRTIEINDTVFSEEEKKKDLNKQSKMYITQTFPDGYAYRIKEEKKQTIRIGKVKIYKGKLSGD
ncbi:hypothetical protein EHQ59_01465 [Leptospira kemamanensis]|uniref:Uncharacterized protein n=1 Tax=Leptospira kemamanensis TaxID=2484942 RepID=A0A4R9JWL3_9LEPT|nr:hypothetical protein [Leptospira kemamanensis]TGL55947.1 hypothetical protein EHQ59_01465 [Leptospira kemamanensis]